MVGICAIGEAPIGGISFAGVGLRRGVVTAAVFDKSAALMSVFDKNFSTHAGFDKSEQVSVTVEHQDAP